jgi:hypothetical protein
MLTDEDWQAEALINYSITEEKVRKSTRSSALQDAIAFRSWAEFWAG